MINKLKLNKISVKIDNFDGYITNIGDIFGKLKNITIKGQITNIKKIEFDNYIFAFVTVKDDNNEIICLLTGIRDDMKSLLKEINANDNYLLQGNVSIINEEDDDDFNDFPIKEYIIDNKLFCVKALERVK